jgi:hypothetical protein
MTLVPKQEAKRKWCHEAMFFKYADENDRCETCSGNKNYKLKDAEEYCSACRYPCGGENCNGGTGPCCSFCQEFDNEYMY